MENAAMSERMTDERLAELDLESVRWKHAPRCRELFAALKAERAKVAELESKLGDVARLELFDLEGNSFDIDELQAALGQG